MTWMTYEEAIEILNGHIDAGVIYGGEFATIKDHVSSLMYSEWDAVQKFYLSDDEVRDNAEATEVYYNGSHSPTNFPSKAFTKRVAAMPAGTQYDIAVNAYIVRWTALSKKFVEVKGLVVKGRRPSNTAPTRTLENTGTCSCCGRNVKLDGGKIVAHGFTIERGYQEGNCFGVGYDPIEVSSEGAKAYAASLINRKAHMIASRSKFVTTRPSIDIMNHRGVVTKTVTDGDASYQRHFETALHRADRDIRWIGEDITRLTNVVTNWKPGTLPG